VGGQGPNKQTIKKAKKYTTFLKSKQNQNKQANKQATKGGEIGSHMEESKYLLT